MESQTDKARQYSSERMARRQGDILAAAREMLADGDGEIRMRDLAERSGVALGTLYNRFGSKEAIAAEAVVEVFREHLVAWDEALGGSVAARLEERVRSSVAEILRQPAFARSMVALYFGTETAVSADVVDLLHAFPKREMAKALEELKSAETLVADANVELLAEEIVLAQYATIARWAKGLIPDDDLSRRLTRVSNNHITAWLKPAFCSTVTI